MKQSQLSILFPRQEEVTYREIPEETWHDLGLDALAEKAERAGAFTFPARFVLAVGNEGHGLSEAVMKAADKIVRIPMATGAESLNAAAAAAVLMWEAYREREKNV